MARSAWLRHVMAVRGKNKGMAFKDVLKLAKKSYKKGGGIQGGDKFSSQPASVDALAPVEAKNGGQDGGEAEEGVRLRVGDVLRRGVGGEDVVDGRQQLVHPLHARRGARSPRWRSGGGV